MNIETLNAKVDKVLSSVTNSQEKFAQTIRNINDDVFDLKKKVEVLENKIISTKEGFTNTVNTNNLPTIIILY